MALLLNKFQGNEFQVEQICQSVKNYSPNNCENTGQIGWLINNMSSYLGEKIEIGFANIINYIIIYSIAFYLFFIFFTINIWSLYLFETRKNTFINFSPFIFLLIGVLQGFNLNFFIIFLAKSLSEGKRSTNLSFDYNKLDVSNFFTRSPILFSLRYIFRF